MDWPTIKQGIDLAMGPTGTAVVLAAGLYVYDKRASDREKKASETQDKLTKTFETTVKDILADAKATQQVMLAKAESAEKLCEARYETLLKELLRNKG